jgi:hypothetical protein
MNEFDRQIRLVLTRHLASRGIAPSVAELAAAVGCDAEDAVASLHRLHDQHQILLFPDSTDIWSAYPFSALPTAFWIVAGDSSWWANCAFCALGVAAAIDHDLVIHARAGGEGDRFDATIRHGMIEPSGAVMHLPLPVSRWYENVVWTCGHVHFFRDVESVDDWCTRHSRVRGETVDIETAWRLARRWYSGYLNADWRPWSVPEINAHFGSCGLIGEFWRVTD